MRNILAKELKIKFVEKQFKIIHSKDTPSEYLRLVFKILKQKEKRYHNTKSGPTNGCSQRKQANYNQHLV